VKKVLGIELKKELVDIAKKNLRNFKSNKTKIEIIHKDASKYNFKEENILFLYNPFAIKTLKKVLNNIKKSLIINPRKISIVYIFYNNSIKDLMNNSDWLNYQGNIEGTDAHVWVN
jgi:predicted RNA methylase